MNRFPIVFAFALLGLTLAPSAARAEDPAPGGCALTSALLVSQDQGTVTIGCSGVSEAFGGQLADVLTRILQDRLDPQMVLAKLDEVERVPQDGVARVVSETQQQTIIQALLGKQPGRIAITAHPQVEDSADYAKSLAAPLIMVGWQIEGHQVRRTAPKLLEGVSGVALVVRSREAPPPQALQLRAALSAAHIVAPLVSDPALPADAMTLWIGRRPVFMPTEAKP
jgi:hypothetical protein